MTSAAYRKRVSEEQLAQLTREYANTLRALGPFRNDGPFERNLDPPFTCSQTKAAAGGLVKVLVTVTKEGDDWQVDQFSIGAYDPFGK
jgi:hypothetical protein